MPKIYVYLNCSTCRNALKWLAQHRIAADVHPIRETPPTVSELRTMLNAYNSDVKKLFNTSGLDYKAQNLKEKLPVLTVSEALQLLAANGNLVKRPFLLGKNIALVGFKENEWREAFAV